jgi:ABC-type antimicrobial peptide transport system permease subunit
MTTAGWAVMIASITCVISLISFCMYRVLTLSPADVNKSMKTPLDIDTGDTENAD